MKETISLHCCFAGCRTCFSFIHCVLLSFVMASASRLSVQHDVSSVARPCAVRLMPRRTTMREKDHDNNFICTTAVCACVCVWQSEGERFCFIRLMLSLLSLSLSLSLSPWRDASRSDHGFCSAHHRRRQPANAAIYSCYYVQIWLVGQVHAANGDHNRDVRGIPSHIARLHFTRRTIRE